MIARITGPNMPRLRRALESGGLDLIYRRACDAYPDECCGMILASGIRPCANVQDKLRTLLPSRRVETSMRAFCFDVANQIFLAESFDGPDPVLAVYHSHTDGSTAFSQTDRAAALADRRPIYPALGHLVVGCAPPFGASSTSRPIVLGARLYLFIGRGFQEIACFSGGLPPGRVKR